MCSAELIAQDYSEISRLNFIVVAVQTASCVEALRVVYSTNITELCS